MKHYFLTVVTFCLFYLTQLTIAQGIIKDDFLVNDDAGSANQNYPSISVDGVGNFVIVWRDFRNGNGDIYYQNYNTNGSAAGVNVKVNDDTGNVSQGYTSIAMDGAGNFLIVWDDDRNTNYDTDIYYQRYTSTGTALGVNIKVNDDVDSVKQWSPFIAMDATGSFVVVWIDERNGNRDIYYQRYTTTGTPSGNNTKVNDDAGNEFQYYPSISMDAVGNFIITWQDFRNSNWDIYHQRYTSTGATLGVNTKVNDDAGNTYQKVPSISVNVVGDFLIVWEDYRYGQTNSDIFGQRYFSSGNPNSGNYRIVADGSNNGETLPVICSYNSSIIFSWEDNRRSLGWDIYAKIVNWNWNGVTGVINEENKNPNDFSLSQNYPNPFNPSTKIKYTIPSDVKGEMLKVVLKVYDVLGIEVATLVNEKKPTGGYEVEFDGNGLTSGIYFYQLKVGDFVESKKMILMK